MKSKIFVFISLIFIGILLGLTSCQDLNNSKQATIDINLDLSKILKKSRNETTQNSEYVLKISAYNAFSYKDGSQIENLPLITKTENKVNASGIVKVRMNIEIGIKVIFVAKLYEFVNNKISENPVYIGNSDIVKIQPVNNKVNLVFTEISDGIDFEFELHTHVFAENWSNNETHHWKWATCGCDVVGEKAKHAMGEYLSNNDATSESDGTKTRKCTVCEYSETVTELNTKIILPETLRTGDYVLTDNTYVSKEYFSELTQEEKEKIFGVVCITDSGEPLILGTQFSINKSKWTASTIGYNTYLSGIATVVSGDNSSGYTFAGDLEGSDNWEYICSVDSTNTEEAQIASMYPAFYYANIYTTYAGLTETDFADGWYVPSINQLYEVYKNIDTISDSLTNLEINLQVSNTSFWSSSVPRGQSKAAYILDYSTGKIENVDIEKNSNYVWVFHNFSNKFERYDKYPDAIISSVEIPDVGFTYTGEIPVTIKGNNLLYHDVTSDESSFRNVSYISNTEATAVISNPGSTGTHTITVNCGNAVYDATINVIKVVCQVGDIILKYETKVSKNDIGSYVIDENNKPIGVVAMITDLDEVATPRLIGLQKGSGLKWASSDALGYNIIFDEISASYSGMAGSYNISGDIDGIDNWEYICKKDPLCSSEASIYYPIFYFANTYGITAGLADTSYAEGWYVPSIHEVRKVYKDKEIIQKSLDAAGGFTIGELTYRSSTQYYTEAENVLSIDFDVCYLRCSSKGTSGSVFVLHAFNAE